MTRFINTAFGRKRILRAVGVYVQTLPTPAAPNGEWWTLNEQRGYVPVSSNSRALLHTLRNDVKKEMGS